MPNIDFQNGFIAGSAAGGAFQQGGGGAQQQADWDQNDNTQVDYIKNRPFYTEATTTSLSSYEFEISSDDDYINIQGYAPTLTEGDVGNTVDVDITVNEVTINATGTVTDLSEDRYGLFVVYSDTALGAFVPNQEFIEGNMVPSEGNSFFMKQEALSGMDATVEIYLPYTTTITTYHTIDPNYIDVKNTIPGGYDVYVEKEITPTELVNQPTTQASYSDIQEGLYMLLQTDTDQFIGVRSKLEYQQKSISGATANDVVWELSGYDTGLGYNLGDTMYFMVKKDDNTETYTMYSYDSEPEAVTTTIDLPSHSYSELSFEMISKDTLDWSYSSSTSTLSANSRSIQVNINYPSSYSVSSYAVSFPNDTSFFDGSGVHNGPLFKIYPIMIFTTDNNSTTITPAKYYKGRYVSDLENGNVNDNINYRITGNVYLSPAEYGFYASFQGDYYHSGFSIQDNGSAVDLTQSTFSCLDSSIANTNLETCTNQVMTVHGTDEDNNMTRATGVEVYHENGYLPLNTKIILRAKTID